MMQIEPANLKPRDAYRLFVSVVTPPPIAWVSTVDKSGMNNIAPFSMYTLLSSVPAVVGFGVGRYRDGRMKDTLRNVEATREFVINVVTEDLAEAMNVTSAPYPPDVSEFDRAGLTPVKCGLVAPMRVGESPISMECRILQILEFGKAPMVNSFVIGEVLLVHVRNDLWRDEAVDSSQFRTVGRLGRGTDLYCRTTDTFEMKRPEVGS